MSIAERSMLISSNLNNAPIYHMSIYLLPKTIIKSWIKLVSNGNIILSNGLKFVRVRKNVGLELKTSGKLMSASSLNGGGSLIRKMVFGKE